ncbi:hypothetical protein G6F64_015215 [Rhizopus arrhizus]|uniref:Uncharacterized protein n=1 Tax=Rhizopus oryzae TaxID=64495 RepID=A0A9P7BIL3_RHIOR|nr:hypothetical protein G6F64_015215 [Rhizopus arrhizus]
MAKTLGQPMIVENKAGGGAAIGANFVARAKPDGYTLLLGTSAAHVVTPLMQRTPYDGIKDFAFVSIRCRPGGHGAQGSRQDQLRVRRAGQFPASGRRTVP